MKVCALQSFLSLVKTLDQVGDLVLKVTIVVAIAKSSLCCVLFYVFLGEFDAETSAAIGQDTDERYANSYVRLLYSITGMILFTEPAVMVSIMVSSGLSTKSGMLVMVVVES